MAAKGMLSRIAGNLGRILLGRDRVGYGPQGTAYYRCMTKNDRGDPVEKRWVEFPGALGHGYYDPSAIPPEWSQWLNRVRLEPPTEEDILQAAAKRALIRGKAVALQAEEAKRKFQAEHLGLQSGPNREAFVRQLTDVSLARGEGQEGARPMPRGAPAQAERSERTADRETSDSGKTRSTSKQDFQPDTWRPGA